MIWQKAKGIDIRMVINYDDVATAPKGKESERRGLISAIGRIVGISAEQGAPIDEVVRLAKKARDNSRAIGGWNEKCNTSCYRENNYGNA